MLLLQDLYRYDNVSKNQNKFLAIRKRELVWGVSLFNSEDVELG